MGKKVKLVKGPLINLHPNSKKFLEKIWIWVQISEISEFGCKSEKFLGKVWNLGANLLKVP